MTDTATIESVEEGFKLAMRELAACVNVITTEHNGDIGGLTATAVCSLSMEPASIIVCVNRSASAYPIFEAGKKMCVNLLGHNQQAVANVFAGRKGVEGADRFAAEGSWTRADNKVPMLDGANANVVCEIAELKQFGSHAICIGKVVEVRVNEGNAPLLYAGQGYDTLASMA